MIESIRKAEQSVLLLDCGGVFDIAATEKAELMLNAMELMGYDALNLGSPELYFGKEFLERTQSKVSFPYIASNLLYRGSKLPWTRDYIIKEVGGIKAAVLGVFNPDDLTQINQNQARGLEVIPPETALKRLLLEVRGKVQLVILLSRLDVKKTRELVQSVKGVDVAISSGSDDVYYVKPLENTILLQTGGLGKVMGFLKITLNEKNAFSVGERRYVSLDSAVPDNERIARLVEKFKKEPRSK